MPRLLKSARAKPGSNSPADPPQKAAPPSPQFTESQQFSPPNGPDQPENRPDSADWPSQEELSLDRTEPFPDGLFRVPVPNAVFGRMGGLSDSALRCLLALIHRSFRFDPAEGEWIHTEDWLSRSDVEAASGLSGQGTRNGLSELQSVGWAEADRTGRSHHYQLALGVPTARFTQVPTALLEELSTFGSGAELRVVLAVLRGTWGWTSKEMDPQSGVLRSVHDWWARLSNRALAKMTGRSKTAVAQAAKALQGEWIERVRPGNEAYQYRFLPGAVGDAPGDSLENDSSEGPESFYGDTTNDLTPDRQNSDPPSFNKKNSSKDKHGQPPKKNEPRQRLGPASGEGSAVPTEQPRGDRPTSAGRGRPKQQTSEETLPSADFSDLPPEKRSLAEKLANVGVWAGRIAELLSRFSRSRIRANFQLYRRRAAEQTIHRPGAWLHEAIVEGYALQPSGEERPREAPKDGPPALKHKETVSEAKKDAYVAHGVGEERFHRCLSGSGAGGEPQFMYFDPEVGGPTSRT